MLQQIVICAMVPTALCSSADYIHLATILIHKRIGNKAHTMSSSIRKFFESVIKLLASECKVTSELYSIYHDHNM